MLRRSESAEEKRQHAERMLAFVARLTALIEGRLSRADMVAWLTELRKPYYEQGPFPKQPAQTVFDSLLRLDETWRGAPVVRDVELRDYLRLLREGEPFQADEEPLFMLDHDIHDFAAQTGHDAVRWWQDGLGWYATVRFCSPVSCRAYVVHAPLERAGPLDFRTTRDDDPTEAIGDLFDALGLDDADVPAVHPRADLTKLPVWVLWRQDDPGNRFEMARFRSYTKAHAEWRTYTERGHRQLYWIEPA